MTPKWSVKFLCELDTCLKGVNPVTPFRGATYTPEDVMIAPCKDSCSTSFCLISIANYLISVQIVSE